MSLNDFDYDVESLKNDSKENNPKILNLIYLIKSTEKEIQSLKRKRLPSLKLEAEAKLIKVISEPTVRERCCSYICKS